MTMMASKEEAKQRLHQRRKQRPLGGGDTSSGGRGNSRTTMTTMTSNKDYDVGWALRQTTATCTVTTITTTTMADSSCWKGGVSGGAGNRAGSSIGGGGKDGRSSGSGKSEGRQQSTKSRENGGGGDSNGKEASGKTREGSVAAGVTRGAVVVAVAVWRWFRRQQWQQHDGLAWQWQGGERCASHRVLKLFFHPLFLVFLCKYRIKSTAYLPSHTQGSIISFKHGHDVKHKAPRLY